MSTDEHQDGTSPPPVEAEEDGRTYANDAVRGSAWNLLQTFGSKGLMVVAQLVLAQLLLPSDWGLAGLAISIAALLTIFGPLPLIDLLTQRGPRIAMALPNAMRLCIMTAIFTSIVIAGSGLIASARSGHTIETVSGGPVNDKTTLEEIRSEPSLPTIIRQMDGMFEIQVEGRWVETALPTITGEPVQLGTYVQELQAAVDKAAGPREIQVHLDEATSRIQISTRDGSPAHIRSWSSAEGAVFDVLGISYRSLPLMLLLLILALVPFAHAFRVPWDAHLRLQLKFGSIAGANFAGTVGSNLGAIVLAILGAGAIALLTTHIVVPVIACVIMYLIARPLPKVPRVDWEGMRTLVTDSSALWLAQWVHTAGLNVPVLVLGLFVTSDEIGFFFFASMMSMQLIVMLAVNLGHAFTPIFSTLQKQPERLASAYLRSASAIAAVTIPLLFGAAATAPVFVPMLFGAKWVPAVPLVTILMVSQAFAVTNPASASVLKGSGRFRTWLVWQATQTSTFLIAVVIAAALGGTTAVAWTVFGEYAIFAPLGIYLCVRGVASMGDIVRVHGVPFIASIPFIGVGIVSYEIGPSWPGVFLWCPISILLAGSIYVAGIRILDRPRYDEFIAIIGRIRAKISSLRPGNQAASEE